MGKKVFLSVLGTGIYKECNYTVGDWKSKPTSFIQDATIDFLNREEKWNPKRDKLIVLLTEKAKDYNWNKNITSRTDNRGEKTSYVGLEKVLDKGGYTPMIIAQPIPDGKDEQEMWEIFNAIYQHIDEGDQLYIDITHSFRYLPMLLLVLCNYARYIKKAEVCSITYGNYEARNKETNEAEINDITPIAILQEWTFAAGEFTKHGKTDELKSINQKYRKDYNVHNKYRFVSKNDSNNFNQYTNLLDEYIKYVQLSQAKKINEKTLIGKILNLPFDEDGSITPLNPIIQKVKASLEIFKDTESPMFYPICAASWAYEKSYYQQAAVMLQEGIISILCQKAFNKYLNKDLRNLIGSLIYIKTKSLENSPESWRVDIKYRDTLAQLTPIDFSTQFINNYNLLTEIRNLLSHGWYQEKEGAMKESTAINNLKLTIDFFTNQNNWPDIAPLQQKTENKPKLLINLSNHPYEKWGEEQKKHAQIYGECKDMLFPQIDPSLSSDDIKEKANELFKNIIKLSEDNSITVHIMGEHTLCYQTVTLLKMSGIPCIASCANREVQEEKEGVKTSVFNFSCFREY